MKTFTRTIVLLCLAAATLAGCSNTPLSKQNVVGTYKGIYASGSETFTIRANGTFTQTFYRNGKKIYTASGSWKVMDSTDVGFAPFVQPGADMTLKGKPQWFSGTRGLWDGMYPRIVFSDDNNYWIIKQKP